jgi:hypothetical protein
MGLDGQSKSSFEHQENDIVRQVRRLLDLYMELAGTVTKFRIVMTSACA